MRAIAFQPAQWLKDEMRLHYLACMNEVIEKYGSLTPLMEAMAHELDFDVFWAKAAKDLT